jgi:hypothetical protein
MAALFGIYQSRKIYQNAQHYRAGVFVITIQGVELDYYLERFEKN